MMEPPNIKSLIDQAVTSPADNRETYTESASGSDANIEAIAGKASTDDDIVSALAQLPPFDYDRIREKKASDLGVRVATLDAQVAAARRKLDLADTVDELGDGIKAWPDAVEGLPLADAVLDLFQRYTVLPPGGAVALTLWCMATYGFDAFRIFPKLCLHSPEKRCGKTTVLEVMNAIVHRGLPTSNVSAAVVYRAIECWKPCLLIDEADTFLSGNEALRGIINSGHTRSGAYVLRVEESGGNREPKRFSTWAPMAIAMIQSPPDTIRDRSIMIGMRRKRLDEKTESMPFDLAEACIELRQKLKRWADDNVDRLRTIEPEVPPMNNDRARDNWRPLLAVAQLLGGRWPEQALATMVKLTSGRDDDSVALWLLRDIDAAFRHSGETMLFSGELVAALLAQEESPWGEWRQGQPMTKNQLARLLKPFGIRSRPIRQNHTVQRGYRLADFDDAFKRYLPPSSPARGLSSVTLLQARTDAGLRESENVTRRGDVTFADIPILNAEADCNAVTLCETLADKENG